MFQPDSLREAGRCETMCALYVLLCMYIYSMYVHMCLYKTQHKKYVRASTSNLLEAYVKSHLYNSERVENANLF